jgi:thioredoxin-related protein
MAKTAVVPCRTQALTLWITVAMLILTAALVAYLLVRISRQLLPLAAPGLRENLEERKPQLLYFSMTECRYCIEFQPMWDKLAKDNELSSQVELHQYSSTHEDFSKLVQQYGVSSYPSLVLVQVSGSYSTFKGQRTEEALKSWVRSSVGT